MVQSCTHNIYILIILPQGSRRKKEEGRRKKEERGGKARHGFGHGYTDELLSVYWG
ncbi:MAG: hypothetical protein ACRC62_18800 [Microcoleus sp.]